MCAARAEDPALPVHKVKLKDEVVCARCRKPAIDRMLEFGGDSFHPECFLCAGPCKKSLDGATFFEQTGKPYCQECFNSLYGKACFRCRKTIETDSEGNSEAISSDGHDYHEACFCCFTCQNKFSTGSVSGAYRVDSELYCEKCAVEAQTASTKTSKRCCQCNNMPTKRMLSALDKTWHPECFRCTYANCKASLDGEKFMVKNEKPYCKGCFQKLFSQKCAGCDESIDTASEAGHFIRSGTKTYHEACFVCATCKMSLYVKGASEAYPVREVLFCKPHAEARAREIKEEAKAKAGKS